MYVWEIAFTTYMNLKIWIFGIYTRPLNHMPYGIILVWERVWYNCVVNFNKNQMKFNRIWFHRQWFSKIHHKIMYSMLYLSSFTFDALHSMIIRRYGIWLNLLSFEKRRKFSSESKVSSLYYIRWTWCSGSLLYFFHNVCIFASTIYTTLCMILKLKTNEKNIKFTILCICISCRM